MGMRAVSDAKTNSGDANLPVKQVWFDATVWTMVREAGQPASPEADAARDGDLGDFKALLGNADSGKFKALLKDNPDLAFRKDTNGWTPLHLAAQRPSKAVVELLLASKAEVNAKDKWGQTPLHLAALNDQKDVAEYLVVFKAEVNAKDNNGSTPLHVAAAGGHWDVAASLLANKAEVNSKDNHGDTPLHWAAEKGHKNVAELLRQHGGHE